MTCEGGRPRTLRPQQAARAPARALRLPFRFICAAEDDPARSAHVHTLIASWNTLEGGTKKYRLSATWASLRLVKVTHKINDRGSTLSQLGTHTRFLKPCLIVK